MRELHLSKRRGAITQWFIQVVLSDFVLDSEKKEKTMTELAARMRTQETEQNTKEHEIKNNANPSAKQEHNVSFRLRYKSRLKRKEPRVLRNIVSKSKHAIAVVVVVVVQF
jgi:hypothetical protein